MDDVPSYKALAKAKYVSVTTFRKTGEPVSTPIWIVADGQALYGFSGAGAGKIKRMRRDTAVRIAPCDMRGRPSAAAREATARILPETEGKRVESLLDSKYPVARRLLRWYGRLRRNEGKLAYFEIRLVEEPAIRTA